MRSNSRGNFYQKFSTAFSGLSITMMKLSNKRFFVLLLLLMTCSFFLVNFIGPGSFRAKIIDGDGSGYYAYLPGIFVFNSVDFTRVFEYEKDQRSTEYQGHYFHRQNGILINKYTSGTAMMELPLFMLNRRFRIWKR